MNVKILRYTAAPDELAGYAAAKCTRAANKDKARDNALASGHESILEHISFTFEIDGVSRVLLAQLTRHRLASYSVESQRYCPFDSLEVIVPPKIREKGMEKEYMETVNHAFTTYKHFLQNGIDAEDARFVLPQGVVTNLVMTMNVRELNHFFSLRTCNRAQWEIRAMADEMLKLCRKVSPILFADSGPCCVRSTCPEKRPCGHPRYREEWDA